MMFGKRYIYLIHTFSALKLKSFFNRAHGPEKNTVNAVYFKVSVILGYVKIACLTT